MLFFYGGHLVMRSKRCAVQNQGITLILASCSEKMFLYFNFLCFLFVYWSEYILKQEIDIKPTMLSLAAHTAQAGRAARVERAMVAQNISNLLWYKMATTKRSKAKRIVQPSWIEWNTSFLGGILNLATSHKRGNWRQKPSLLELKKAKRVLPIAHLPHIFTISV